MIDYVSRQAVIDYLMVNMVWHDEDGYEVDDHDEKLKIVTNFINGIPSCWVSVKSNPPGINEPVLFTGKNCIGNRYPAQKGYYSGDEWYTFGGLWDTPLDRVTHWMPLPEPPKE